MKPKDEYEDGVCPDCLTPISDEAEFGDHCLNCEHVFNNTENENCLAGMACPKCKSKGPFRIVATCWALVSDDGIEDTTEHEWEVDAACICARCKHDAKVKDFESKSDQKCEKCGGTDRVALQPNPYEADINGDHSDHLLCEPCCETLRDEI